MISAVVIGLGGIATRHRKNIKQLLPGVKVYSLSASGRNITLPIEHADAVLSSMSEVIQLKPDFVIIASPSSLHSQHAIPLIEANIPILIEKPIAATTAQANALVVAFVEHRTPVAIGYCLRFMPAALKLKAIIDSNLLGDIYHCACNVGQYLPDWRPSKNYLSTVSANAELGGGVLLELSHELDYLQWILGDLKFEHAILRSSNELNLTVEEIADLTLSTGSGIICQLHMDFLQRIPQRKCQFMGLKGRVEWDLVENSITVFNQQGTQLIYSEPTWDRNIMYLDMLKSFIAQIHNDLNDNSTVSQAAKTIALIDTVKDQACYRGRI
ncbi:oxidoreductase [Shewanella sp. 11B5]|uniref:Gfo/Idh/MocA family protein n=1 Tax=Shewanella sp. 11B5 TaxID=2058298 RepID=UPI000C7B9D77|nr:Gfo/Idh/MocA family oxidoreductase [Shewanella sp. 11B5]PKI04623.1 oxidoreductase [Shewanella sp. 11B5]